MMEGGGDPPPADPGEQSETEMDNPKDTRKSTGNKENYLYTVQDDGPYRIYVESANAEKINKFSLGSVIRKMDKYRHHVIELKYLGRNKIIVFMNSYKKANLFVGDERVKECGYKAYIPRHLLCVTGVLAGIPTDISVEEIKQEIECDYQVVDVYRLNQFVEGRSRPTNRVSVTFRAKQLPEKVKLFCCTQRISPFIQKVLFCQKCHRFNHKTENCKGKRRCANCSEIHDEEESYKHCANDMKCLYCKSANHRTVDAICPEKEKQRTIKSLMAKRSLTYVEARELAAPVLTSNIYEALAESTMDPTPAESFAKMTAGKFAKKTATGAIPKRRMDTSPKEGHSQEIVQQKLQNNDIKEKRLRTDKDNRAPTRIITPNTEQERWENITSEARKAAKETAEQNMRGMLMNFYSDLVQNSEMSQELQQTIKEVSKRHFKLDNTIF
ncbi:uncharacterized protein LOC131683653 [Topomyia yanbarensis]|uniref:uncharacterized protein LOC131683653 n=1 Tax=Topomyia yanbarensis TaxID=2498891 RepID=UPI00273C9FF3|nr:uncharacterized protein LOC131683653 [Topomyia yanbarensis]